jgi:hypothetical protein
MIERQGPPSLSRQCELLELSRAALYYQAVRTGARCSGRRPPELMLATRAVGLERAIVR